MYAQDWECPPVTDEIIATLPNANIKECDENTWELFEYTVPTVFGHLTIHMVPADDLTATHKKLLVSYSKYVVQTP